MRELGGLNCNRRSCKVTKSVEYSNCYFEYQESENSMTTRPITEDDRAFIVDQARAGLDLLTRYAVAEPAKLSRAKVAAAFDAWRSDVDPSRPDEIDVIRAFGCLLGFWIEKSSFGNWVVVNDSFGETYGISHLRTGWILYPLDIISKRIKTGSGAELISVVEVFAEGLTPHLPSHWGTEPQSGAD